MDVELILFLALIHLDDLFWFVVFSWSWLSTLNAGIGSYHTKNMQHFRGRKKKK